MNVFLLTHRTLAACLLSLIAAAQATATSVSGHYQGLLSGEPVSLQLQEEGHQVSGVLSDTTYSYSVEAQVAGEHLSRLLKFAPIPSATCR